MEFHENVGNVQNTFEREEQTLITGLATLSFDFLPKGAKDKAHNIEMGFLYERRDDRRYVLRPFGLWNLADRIQNNNLNGTALDFTKRLRDTIIQGQIVPIYAPLANVTEGNSDFAFPQRYRQKFGLDPLSQGNVNNLKPEDMSLDLFSARELHENGLIGYNGFDYLGNRLGSNVAFNDFFTARGADGVRTFPVAANRPEYLAAYIQDKFRYKDIIFSIGVRIDRFDANTKVLRDPYSLYDLMTAKEFYDDVLKTTKPTNIGDDYKVYLTSSTLGKVNFDYKEDNIRGYRLGDQWYSRNGQPVDPVNLFGQNARPFPKYKSDVFRTIKQDGFDPNISFTDYTPQVNVMPRLAFSFPISDVANFFAHYDVLVARPTNNNVTALDYYYFDDAGRTPEDNANLKPERTIDYEVGFQQKLNNWSGLKIAAYYKEMRDMIQLRLIRYLPGSVSEYLTYDNIDFGNVKGFTFQYDLRQTNHFSSTINYTLQFADGTGSDAASQRGINRNGNIRVLSPLNFDERHRVTATFDYRYDSPAYDGPVLFGKNVFDNAGINLQLTTVSGRPYTKRVTPTPFSGAQFAGEINGSRLPWTLNLDMRIDKTFPISKNPKTPLDLNVYLRVQNVLDARNVRAVYTASGSPSDDGYLTSSRGKRRIRQYCVNSPRRFGSLSFFIPNAYARP
ncbi:MAG: TonB-dependent receptor [Saprospiraceae bacterium]|nr:TonB-dependent receptor [Saprospiraceae bacterium]